MKRRINKPEEIVELVYELAKEKGVTINSIEQKAMVSQGLISRWKKVIPTLSTFMMVLEAMEGELFIEIDIPEEGKKIKNEIIEQNRIKPVLDVKMKEIMNGIIADNDMCELYYKKMLKNVKNQDEFIYNLVMFLWNLTSST